MQTPDHGINFDSNSAVKSAPSGSVAPFGWFKTMIEHSQIETVKWPDYSQGAQCTIFIEFGQNLAIFHFRKVTKAGEMENGLNRCRRKLDGHGHGNH
jgi:hypothetical protein